MNPFGVISYGAACAGFLILLAMLVTSWQGRATGRRLIVAVAVTAVWAAVHAWHAWQPTLSLMLLYTVEILRDGAWIGVLLGLGRQLVPQTLAMVARSLWVGLLVAPWALAFLGGPGFGLQVLQVPGGIVMALVVLVLMEQVYRNAGAAHRNALRFLVIGLGGVYCYDLFLFSQAALFNGFPADAWYARGLATAMLVPLIAIAAQRNPHWSLNVFVSRQVVLFTTTVIAAGVYLFLMAIGGYLLQAFGGRWSMAASIVYFFGAAVVLAVVVMSGIANRRLKVFLSKHFFRNKYDYRAEWLRFVDTLSRPDSSGVRSTCLQAIAQIFDSPGAVLYVADSSGQQMVPAAAWPMKLEDLPGFGPIPADHELLRLMRDRKWVVDLNEPASKWAGGQVNVPAGLSQNGRVRLLAPLLQSRELLGFVMLYEPPAPFKPTYEDRDLLRTVGRHVATLIAQQDADRRLAESRQFEAYHRLTAFLMHDLKNAVAQLQLAVDNAERHKGNPAFIDDMISTVGNAAERMNRLIGQLRDTARTAVPDAVDLLAVARIVADRCSDRLPAPALTAAAAGTISVRADSTRLTSVLEHVIRNAQDASGPGDRIDLAIAADGDGQARIVVEDSGTGMSAAFLRERLFRPFDSTKGPKGVGIGAYQVREYVQSLGGSVTVQSNPGQGTRFEIRLPMLNPAQGSP